jgi:flavin-dependent dehydrogenase
MIQAKYDAVILGGGPAGMATALSLRSQADVSILLLDADEAERERAGESVPPDLLVPLGRLRLVEQFRAGGHFPCPGNASVWGRDRVGHNDSILNPMGTAWRLDRQSFDRMLSNATVERGIHLYWQTRFLDVKPATLWKRGGHHLLLSNPKLSKFEVQAKCVIDATGSSARFARAVGVRKYVHDKIFALARFSKIDSGSMTMQTLLESTSEGWWYAVRLPRDRVIVMFVTERNLLRQNKVDNHQGWERALSITNFVGPTLAKLGLTDSCYYTFPIYSSILDKIEGDDWIATGDAAVSYDPIVAQGIYKAISDGVAAGKRAADLIAGHQETSVTHSFPYQERIRKNFSEYCKNRSYLYGLEQRWLNASFWRHRWERTVI